MSQWIKVQVVGDVPCDDRFPDGAYFTNPHWFHAPQDHEFATWQADYWRAKGYEVRLSIETA